MCAVSCTVSPYADAHKSSVLQAWSRKFESQAPYLSLSLSNGEKHKSKPGKGLAM